MQQSCLGRYNKEGNKMRVALVFSKYMGFWLEFPNSYKQQENLQVQ